MPAPKVYPHPPHSPLLQAALKGHLPYSINLVYRTQHENRTKDACVLATFPVALTGGSAVSRPATSAVASSSIGIESRLAVSSGEREGEGEVDGEESQSQSRSSLDSSVPRCWAAAYLDRSMRPETELWVFAAGEVPGHGDGEGEERKEQREIRRGREEEQEEVSQSCSSTQSTKDAFCKTCEKAVLSLLDYMATLPIPPLHPDNMPALERARLWEAEQQKGEQKDNHQVPTPENKQSYTRQLLLPNVLTLGCCHHAVVQICRSAGILREDFPGIHGALNKFCFKLADLPATRELPAGLIWSEVQEKDISVVKARTSIPRTGRTLMSLKSVAVIGEERDVAVAWAFLGLDGSLTTLHTEEGYRGRGIGKAVAAGIFRRHASGLAVDGQGIAWAHADVYKGNAQSESVCRSLGGTAMWECFWVRIDLERAGTLAEGL